MSASEALAHYLSGSLNSGHLFFALVLAFGGGLLTALTPCVYPLIPITVRYFGAMGPEQNKQRLSLALLYVAGMAVLYAFLGLVFASLGKAFGTFMGNPWVLLGIAAFCLLMGMSMLGAFNLQLPVALSTRLSRVGGKSKSGAFLMGLVSGFIAAPCTGPVLAVILTVIVGAGAMSTGFFLMLSFSAGVGLPFLALALSAGLLSRLPQSGAWMELVKIVLATAMFVVALYFAQFALPELIKFLAEVPAADFLGAIILFVAFCLALLYGRFYDRRHAPWLKIAAVFSSTFALSLLLFAPARLSGDPKNPQLVWETAHDSATAKAKSEKRPVMIDFTAEWCQACKELDRHTYVDNAVQSELARFVNVKIDATELNDATQALFDRYGILGLPTVVFIDSAGITLGEPRVTGFVAADRFLQLLNKVK